MKEIKISSFPPGKDIKRFKNLKEERSKIINKTDPDKIPESFKIKELGEKLHPGTQKLIIKNIVEMNNDIKIFYFANACGEKLATFRPGQYITLLFEIDGNSVSRTYSLSSSPKEALDNVYRISVKRLNGGLVSNYMLDNLNINDTVTSLAPSGDFYPSTIRDMKSIVGITHDEFISPFVSMAKAISEGYLNKDITIFYLSHDNEFIYKYELQELSKNNTSIKVIFINSNDNEINNITASLIKSEVTSKFTAFCFGNYEFYDYINTELSVLELGLKDLRFESYPIYQKCINDSVAPADVVEIQEELPKKRGRKKKEKDEEEAQGEVQEAPKVEEKTEIPLPKVYNIKVFSKDDEYNIICAQNETILSALENNNIKAKSRCKSGVCGYCRTLLLWGTVSIGDGHDHRRQADIKFNYIHPCCTYPTSDITIKIDI